MASDQKITKMKPRTARGFRDLSSSELRMREKMIGNLREIFERFGFDGLETPIFEYTECIGKFLPDTDRPDNGVFSLQDDREEWISLRYDLTAPLARYYAANEMFLPKPYRRFQTGSVFRNEKPGPGRYREFRQFDADTVGTASLAADAEWPLLLAAAFDSLDIKREDYHIKIGHRKIMSAVTEKAGLVGDDADTVIRRGIALRAVDKMDRLGADGVRALLGEGRKDSSGDFTKGAGLQPQQIDSILNYVTSRGKDNDETLKNLRRAVAGTEQGAAAIDELSHLLDIVAASNPNAADRVLFCPSVVRGLGYYTGVVLEAELTFDVPNEKGEIVEFGSVAGGGRYDGLITRFTGREIPATGVSIGADRLLTALLTRSDYASHTEQAPFIMICVADREHLGRSVAIASLLRDAGFRCEAYAGDAGLKAQFKYADKRGAAFVIIEGSDERDNGTLSVKDLRAGAAFAEQTADREEWKKDNPAQVTIPAENLIEYLNKK